MQRTFVKTATENYIDEAIKYIKENPNQSICILTDWGRHFQAIMKQELHQQLEQQGFVMNKGKKFYFGVFSDEELPSDLEEFDTVIFIGDMKNLESLDAICDLAETSLYYISDFELDKYNIKKSTIINEGKKFFY